MGVRSNPAGHATPRVFAVPLVAIALLQLLGCVQFHGAAADRYHAAEAPAFPPGWWPERRVQDLDEIAAALPRLIRTRDPDSGANVPVLRLATAEVLGPGIVQALRPTDTGGRLLQPDEAPQLRFVSLREDMREVDAVADPALIGVDAGIPFSFREPAAGTAARALVIRIDGAAGALDPIEDQLLEHGFAVARVAPPSMASRPFHVDVGAGDALDEPARALARHVDELLADRVYAIEGVVRYLDLRRPDLSPGALVLLGDGEGTLALPAAALRLAGRVRAAVFVGGAAHVLELALSSEDLDLGIHVLGIDGLSDAKRRWLLDLYLARARLDPYRTAPHLARTPALCFMGQWDDQVPNPVSALLWERLERPDRFRILGDHDDVIDAAADRAAWIAQWIIAAL